MRTFEDIGGRLSELSSQVNDAYLVYASIYLDFEDDNINHLMCRNINIRPLVERDVYYSETATDEDKIKAYLDEAVEIAKRIMSSGYFKSFEEFYKEYPMLRIRSAELEENFYEENL